MAEISFVGPERLDDPDLRAFFEQAVRQGTPRPEIVAIRAHRPEILRAWIQKWNQVFKSGIVERPLKELLRVRVSSSLACSY